MELTLEEIWFWFVNIPYIGRRTRHKLLQIFETPYELYYASDTIIKGINFINDQQKNSLLSKDYREIKNKMKQMCNKGIEFDYIVSDKFPRKLLNIPDCPHGLYYKGNAKNFNMPSVAIVGSRNCSSYGGNIAYKISYELALNGITVISGMAKGIDGAAQRGCLAAGGYTCAVLGCGPDVCYPKSNIDLYMDVHKNGCIISEYAPGTPPVNGLFPERNRIISGLGDVLIVVEAGERSGSLITADCALEQGKDVYAVPGRITDVQSRGCNELIRNGAEVFENTEDILNALNVIKRANLSTDKNSNIVLATEEKIVYAELGLEPKHINSLARETKLPVEVVMSVLINLELRHIVRQITGDYFVVNN